MGGRLSVLEDNDDGDDDEEKWAGRRGTALLPHGQCHALDVVRPALRVPEHRVSTQTIIYVSYTPGCCRHSLDVLYD